MLKTNESGRSMIEMLGVLAIIGVLSVGGIAGYSKAMNKFKTNKLTDQVSMIVTNIRTLYAQQTTYDGLDNKTAVSMGVIPDEMVDKDASGNYESLTNPYNGNVYVSSGFAGANMAGGSSTDKKAFLVKVDGISREACVALAVNDWGSGSSSGLIAIKAEGSIKTADASSSGFSLISNAYAADGDSASGGSTTTASIDDSDMFYGCTGSTGTISGKAIACPGGSATSVPMQVSKAAQACDCGTTNNCALTWKYY